MDIYGLTNRGRQLARSTHHPDTADWQVVHYLDKTHKSTKEQISEYCGLSPIEASVVIWKLKAKGIVAGEDGANF